MHCGSQTTRPSAKCATRRLRRALAGSGGAARSATRTSPHCRTEPTPVHFLPQLRTSLTRASPCDCRTEYRPLRDELERELLKGDMSGLGQVLSHSSVKWLLERDCDDADDVRRMMSMQDRLARAQSFFETGVHPKWERPPPKPRDFSRQVGSSPADLTWSRLNPRALDTSPLIGPSALGLVALSFVPSSMQVAKTALKAGGEVLNVAAWGNIKLGYRAVKLAATGYRLSEQVSRPPCSVFQCEVPHFSSVACLAVGLV